MQYNEIEYGRRIKEEGFQSHNIQKELLILSKYLKHEEGMKLSEHKEFVYKFCEENITDFNEIKHFKVVDSCIRKGRDNKQKPIKIESIPIYLEHLKKIDSCDMPNDYKKVLLAMVVNRYIYSETKRQREGLDENDVLFVYYNQNRNNKDIFNSSRIGATYKIKDIIKDLTHDGLLKDIGRSRIIMEYASEVEGNNVFYNLKPQDFDKVGWVWDLYKNNGKVIKCEECDVLVKKKSNRIKYCADCAREIESKNATVRKRRQRNSVNVTI